MIATVGAASGVMLMLSVADAVLPALSRTCAVKVNNPAAAGVPEMLPEEDNVKPAGSEPLRTDQVYAPAPPLAVNVAL